MIRIHDISLSPDYTPDNLKAEAARLLRLSANRILQVHLVRRSVDARKKSIVRYVCTVDVEVSGKEAAILQRSGCKKAEIVHSISYSPPKSAPETDTRPVVIGFGPAGMFAGLILAMAGLRPIIFERGDDAATRREKVNRFFLTGQLDDQSNVQFGEGGAGTFSDGKLNTGVNNPRIGWILEQFHRFGAREDILYDSKPHVGTDVLFRVVQNLRKEICRLGGEVRFRTQVTGFLHENGVLTGLKLSDNTSHPCRHAILAIGHSARDTFSMLRDTGIRMERKPFAMGVRIEHLQDTINRSQYGQLQSTLPPADYKLVVHLDNHTVYSFCMCPGGYVVAAASQEEGVVTNGMSNADRDGENANAALLVSLNPDDFPYPGVLGGVRWQQELERKAFLAGGGNYHAPAQTVGDFLSGSSGNPSPTVTPSYRPGVTWTDLHDVLPPVITDCIRQALPLLDRKLAGFAAPDAVLTAPETRSSSPVRILRDDRKTSNLSGLYPAGEGAGYAGGIMSAAIDGICCAEALIENLKEKS